MGIYIGTFIVYLCGVRVRLIPHLDCGESGAAPDTETNIKDGKAQ